MVVVPMIMETETVVVEHWVPFFLILLTTIFLLVVFVVVVVVYCCYYYHRLLVLLVVILNHFYKSNLTIYRKVNISVYVTTTTLNDLDRIHHTLNIDLVKSDYMDITIEV